MIRLHGRLFAPDDRGPSVVEVRDGVVASIEPAAGTVDGALGGPDMLLLPGMIDTQVNGAFGVDFSDPEADLDLVRRRLPELGVTAFMPTVVTSPLDAYPAILRNLRRGPAAGMAHVIGTHLEGPYLSSLHPGTHDPALLRPPSLAEAGRWLEEGDVREVTIAPELPGALELIGALARRGVIVSMGHSDATWTEAEAGATAGVRMGTHLFNAMRPLRHRDPGLVGYLLASHLPIGFIADGNHLAFETIRLLARVKAPDELVLVTDALAGLGMPPGEYQLAGRTYVSDGTAGRLPDGTLSGSLLPLHRAIRNLVGAVGLEPSLAVRMATLNAARAVELEDRMGRVEVGRPADLVLLDAGWEVHLTLIGGVVAWPGPEAVVPR